MIRLAACLLAMLLRAPGALAQEEKQAPSETRSRYVPATVDMESVLHPDVEKKSSGAGPSLLDAPPIDEKTLPQNYSDAVHKYIGRRTKGGAFELPDPLLKKRWRLNLLSLHTADLFIFPDDRVVACAEFREAGGKRRLLDVDFYARQGENRWEVVEVVIHRAGGRPRFEYNEARERVPAR